MPTLHALDFLAQPGQHRPAGVCVLFGDEPFLKRLALEAVRRLAAGDDAEASIELHDCEDRPPEWRDVADALATVSLFGGGGPRIVVLQGADGFVSTHRPRLEDYVAKPRRAGLLILLIDEFASNTRLYKAVDQAGLAIDCRPPQKGGKSKDLDEGQIVKWIVAWGQSRHQVLLDREAAQLLLDLSGPSFGLLDQDLAKLALFATSGGKTTPEMVQQIVGGWRTKTTWDLVDAAAAGNAAEALVQLDRLLQAGEHPLALVGSIGWSLRRYAAAVRVFERAERGGSRISLREALAQAGVRDWPLGALAKSEERLKQLGRRRAGQLYRWLLDLDLALKGSHSQDDHARWALEQLILRMTKAAPVRA
ncbi:MAG: DNA polymerase III subunit delta [Pirellulaceae bacterium]|nr:DNA polymerase III subunit delta [Pirellulaceae bacterium]